jgi:hypothetical protein
MLGLQYNLLTVSCANIGLKEEKKYRSSFFGLESSESKTVLYSCSKANNARFHAELGSVC